jgi:hypothetical protein
VIVALRARDGEAEEGGAERVDAVDDALDAELLGVDATLLVDLGVAVEAGGYLLFDGGVGQEVAGELFDDELIVGQIAIEGVDDPVAVLPDLARGIDRVAVGVGVAGEVEPRSRPAFAVVRGGEQALDEALVGIGAICRGGRWSASAGDGGRPVRSRWIRRSRVTRSAAGGRGEAGAAVRRARMKASSGFMIFDF